MQPNIQKWAGWKGDGKVNKSMCQLTTPVFSGRRRIKAVTWRCRLMLRGKVHRRGGGFKNKRLTNLSNVWTTEIRILSVSFKGEGEKSGVIIQNVIKYLKMRSGSSLLGKNGPYRQRSHQHRIFIQEQPNFPWGKNERHFCCASVCLSGSCKIRIWLTFLPGSWEGVSKSWNSPSGRSIFVILFEVGLDYLR